VTQAQVTKRAEEIFFIAVPPRRRVSQEDHFHPLSGGPTQGSAKANGPLNHVPPNKFTAKIGANYLR